MFSFLSRFYPILFLALVICGPVLLLPHTMPVFLFVATIDSLVSLGFAGIFTVACVLHLTMPDHFKEMSADIAAKIIGRTRAQKLAGFFNRLCTFSGMALLIVSSHPYFAACALAFHAAATAFIRLVAHVHQPPKD